MTEKTRRKHSVLAACGAEGGIWTLAAFFRHPTPLAGEPLRPLGYFCRYDIHWLKMWRREWDSNPRTLARRRFTRPVPSTARTSLHHGKAPSVGRLIIILYRLAICQQSAPIFIFLIFFILGVAFPETVCYYNWADFEQHISGCGAVGSALDWGSRGREFKSRHSDQKETTIFVRKLSFLFFNSFLLLLIGNNWIFLFASFSHYMIEIFSINELLDPYF